MYRTLSVSGLGDINLFTRAQVPTHLCMLIHSRRCHSTSPAQRIVSQNSAACLIAACVSLRDMRCSLADEPYVQNIVNAVTNVPLCVYVNNPRPPDNNPRNEASRRSHLCRCPCLRIPAACGVHPSYTLAHHPDIPNRTQMTTNLPPPANATSYAWHRPSPSLKMPCFHPAPAANANLCAWNRLQMPGNGRSRTARVARRLKQMVPCSPRCSRPQLSSSPGLAPREQYCVVTTVDCGQTLIFLSNPSGQPVALNQK